MKILLLAPHPFYMERGTPIAVDLLLRVLSEAGHEVDVLTFPTGSPRSYPSVRLIRVKSWLKLGHIPPGFSLKKIYCDILMFFKLLTLLVKQRYDVIHAVEEAVFMAMVLYPFTKTPYVYDMDSSMVTQLLDKFAFLKPVAGVLRYLEALPLRHACVVLPVCEALAKIARAQGAKSIHIIPDISLLDALPQHPSGTNIRERFNIRGSIVLYVGNLETYQGIDLLLESWPVVIQQHQDARLLVIGGSGTDIQKYQNKAQQLGVQGSVVFMGPRPVNQLGDYLKQADVLVSPRVQGVNTPMKLYTYLDSGIPVVASDLETHTQVMTTDLGLLASPQPQAFGAAVARLIADKALGNALAIRARAFIVANHSYASFKQKVLAAYVLLDPSKKR